MYKRQTIIKCRIRSYAQYYIELECGTEWLFVKLLSTLGWEYNSWELGNTIITYFVRQFGTAWHTGVTDNIQYKYLGYHTNIIQRFYGRYKLSEPIRHMKNCLLLKNTISYFTWYKIDVRIRYLGSRLIYQGHGSTKLTTKASTICSWEYSITCLLYTSRCV